MGVCIMEVPMNDECLKSISDMGSDEGIPQDAVWMGQIKCPKCARGIKFTIGNNEEHKAFRYDEKIFNCNHCHEEFKLYSHPCYICGENCCQKLKISCLDLYLCEYHSKQYSARMCCITQKITGEETHEIPEKAISEMITERISLAREGFKGKLLVNEYRSPQNWKILMGY